MMEKCLGKNNKHYHFSDKTNGGIKMEPNIFKEQMIRETFSSNQELSDEKLNLMDYYEYDEYEEYEEYESYLKEF